MNQEGQNGCKTVFDVAPVSYTHLEVMGDDAAVTVTLDSDTANKLSIKVLQKYLGILGNGAVSYQEDGTEKYITPELNMLDKEMKKLFGIDVIDDGESSEDIDVLGLSLIHISMCIRDRC